MCGLFFHADGDVPPLADIMTTELLDDEHMLQIVHSTRQHARTTNASSSSAMLSVLLLSVKEKISARRTGKWAARTSP